MYLRVVKRVPRSGAEGSGNEMYTFVLDDYLQFVREFLLLSIP